MKTKEANNKNILGMRVDPTSYRDVARQIIKWAVNGENRYVCVANVHMVMEAYEDATLRKIVNQADLVVPDGMPLVWMLRRFGHSLEDRVYGPTLVLRVLEAASRHCIPMGFYGGAPDVLAQLVKNIQNRYKNIQTAYRFSPPFRELTPEEDKAIVQNIEASQTRILFVGLGCPKQEKWMAAHVDRIQAVMVGVGAAFDFHAGKIRQAPKLLQDYGMEWMFRLIIEPGRLWKRYLTNNPRFAVLAIKELARKNGEA
jgi:N-acetylglucosaminyldiphosphoundecaprenol N-acetyl-beta-D-mannosaminyltransferase